MDDRKVAGLDRRKSEPSCDPSSDIDKLDTSVKAKEFASLGSKSMRDVARVFTSC